MEAKETFFLSNRQGKSTKEGRSVEEISETKQMI